MCFDICLLLFCLTEFGFVFGISALSQSWSLAVLAFGILTTAFWLILHHPKWKLESAQFAAVELTDFNSRFGREQC
jgi:hypothetical protein